MRLIEINTGEIIDNVVSEALEREIDGKTIKQWMTEIAKHQWISVKDRPPDRDGEYMVYGQSEAMRELLPDNDPIWICHYYKERGFYNIELCRGYDYITHWMPLPEPPEEVTGDA